MVRVSALSLESCMFFPLMLIFLLQNPEESAVPNRTLYIVYDDSNESKFLHSELTRDWNSKGVSEASTEMDKIQKDLAEKIVLLYRYDTKNLKLRNISVGYPCFYYGEYGTPQKYPVEAFNEVSYPLRTTQAIYSEITTDLTAWKDACKHKEEMTRWNHYLSISEFGNIFPGDVDNLAEVNAPEDDDNWIPWEDFYPVLIYRFKDYDGFPQIEKITYPENPIIKRPWEDK